LSSGCTVFAEQRVVPIDAGVDRVIVQAADQALNVSSRADWRR
jgi:hypothetical protein